MKLVKLITAVTATITSGSICQGNKIGLSQRIKEAVKSCTPYRQLEGRFRRSSNKPTIAKGSATRGKTDWGRGEDEVADHTQAVRLDPADTTTKAKPPPRGVGSL
jgi:hypothetical protein